MDSAFHLKLANLVREMADRCGTNSGQGNREGEWAQSCKHTRRNLFITVAPGGGLIVGSASTPFVYKVSAGHLPLRSLSTPVRKALGRFLRHAGGRFQQYVVDLPAAR